MHIVGFRLVAAALAVVARADHAVNDAAAATAALSSGFGHGGLRPIARGSAGIAISCCVRRGRRLLVVLVASVRAVLLAQVVDESAREQRLRRISLDNAISLSDSQLTSIWRLESIWQSLTLRSLLSVSISASIAQP